MKRNKFAGFFPQGRGGGDGRGRERRRGRSVCGGRGGSEGADHQHRWTVEVKVFRTNKSSAKLYPSAFMFLPHSSNNLSLQL